MVRESHEFESRLLNQVRYLSGKKVEMGIFLVIKRCNLIQIQMENYMFLE